MSRPSAKCRSDSAIKPASARSEYRSARPGSPENRTAFVTSSETISSAVSAVLSLIPRHEFRNERVYRRAQNGEVGSVTKDRLPESRGRGWPGRAGCHADPMAGPASDRASCVIVTTSLRSVLAGWAYVDHDAQNRWP